MRFEPICDRVDILRSQSVSPSQFLRGQPMMVVRRLRVLELIDVFVERLFPLGRPKQLEEHVIQRKVRGDGAAIICRRRFRTRIAGERRQLRDRLPAQRSARAAAILPPQPAGSPQTLRRTPRSTGMREYDSAKTPGLPLVQTAALIHQMVVRLNKRERRLLLRIDCCTRGQLLNTVYLRVASSGADKVRSNTLLPIIIPES